MRPSRATKIAFFIAIAFNVICFQNCSPGFVGATRGSSTSSSLSTFELKTSEALSTKVFELSAVDALVVGASYDFDLQLKPQPDPNKKIVAIDWSLSTTPNGICVLNPDTSLGHRSIDCSGAGQVVLSVLATQANGESAGALTLTKSVQAEIELVNSGKTLYQAACAGCHAPVSNSTKQNRSLNSVLSSLDAEPAMQSPQLDSLTSTQIRSIVAALDTTLTSATPTPSPTPLPTPSPTPRPTATPVQTPVPTATPISTPQPTATPVLPTPRPTATPVATATPVSTPRPTATPVSTPVPTPLPTATPVPTPIVVAGSQDVFGGTQANASCVVESGAVFCMGTLSNINMFDLNKAELKSPSNVFKASTRTKISGLPSISKVAVGGNAACGLTAGGEIWCWGWNYDGQLGNGKVEDVIGLGKVSFADPNDRFVELSAGGMAICAINTKGEVWCWGGADKNVITCGAGCITGLPNPANYAYKSVVVPFKMYSGSPKATAVSIGYGTGCITTTSNDLRCWGYAAYGAQSISIPIAGMSGVTDMVLGKYNACAIAGANREVTCWDLSSSNNKIYTQVITSFGTGVKSLATNKNPGGICALTSDGTVKCTVTSDMGLSTNMTWSQPTTLSGVSNIKHLSSGFVHVCAQTMNADIYCWGLNGASAVKY